MQINDITGLISTEHSPETGKVIVRMIHKIRENVIRCKTSHATQFMLKSGLESFRETGKEASTSEPTQKHQWTCFYPKLVCNLSASERKNLNEDL